MAFLPLDGGSKQYALSVNTSTVQEIKSGTVLTERKVITLQPLSADLWVYFGDGVNTPNAATVAAGGFKHFKNARESYEVGEQQPVFILSVSGTNDVRIAERA